MTRFALMLLILGFFHPASAQLIEEILVTAQKRAEDVQDVPISISTFSGDALADSGIHDLQELGMYAPNLTLSRSSQVANNRIIMRGVGSVGNNAIEPSVAVFIDGVYYPRPASVVGSLADIEMVEVLRGPQGTLFGRNASMGALNIRTARPTEEFEGEVRGSFGDYDAYRVSGTVSGGITENTSGRLSLSYSDHSGYGDNTYTVGASSDEVSAWTDASIRGKLWFTPIDNLDILLSFDYSSVDNDSSVIEVKSDTVLPSYLPTLSTVLNPPSPTYTFTPGGPVPDAADTFDYNVNQDHRDNAEDDQYGISGDITWEVGEHTLRSITAYREWNNNSFESALRLPADLLNRVTGYDTETISQEFQILSPTGGKFEYVAGFYYYDEEYSIDQDFDLGVDFCSPAIGNLVGAGSVRSGAAAAAAVASVLAGSLVPLGVSPNNALSVALTIAGGVGRGVITAAAQVQAILVGAGVSGPVAAAAAPAILANTQAGLANLTPAQVVQGANAIAGQAVTACNAGDQEAAIDGSFYQEMTSIALYGQLTYNFTEQLRITGGLRWTSDEKDGSFSQIIRNPIVDSPVAPTGLPFSVNLRINESFPALSFSDDELTWLLNLTYYVTEDLMVFGNYSTGYKSGGFNSDGANRVIPRTFNSETVDNYELGMKSTLFDSRMTANLTLFRTEISDFQDRQFDGVSFIVQNAGELTQQGVELDIQARPIQQLYATLGLSYLDSEFDSFPNATSLPYVIATTPPGQVPPGQNLTGSRNHFSPEWQMSLAGEWTDAIPNTGINWFLRGEYNHIGEQNIGAETNQNPQSVQEAYDLLNARLGLRSQDDRWEATLFVKNATDEGYCQTIYNQPIGTTLGLVDPITLGGMQRCVLGTPRTFGVEAAYRF